MNNINNVKKEMNIIISHLVGDGISTYQQYPVIKEHPNCVKKLEWNSIINLSISLRNLEYESIYSEIDKNKDYNIKLIDGNIIQMLYTFKDNQLYSHRLAMFPSPSLEMFQNDPEIYENDEIYADIISKKIVPFPIRFDYNKDEINSQSAHPYSHVSLGEYLNCRIPAYGPISPHIFMSFILESFYNTYYIKTYKMKNTQRFLLKLCYNSRGRKKKSTFQHFIVCLVRYTHLLRLLSIITKGTDFK